MAKLSDRQRKQIITDRVNGMSLRKIGAKYGVAETTIRRVLKSDPKTAQRVAAKKEEHVQDMFAFMDDQKGSVQEFIQLGLAAMKDETKLKKAGVQSIATAIGIVLDKYLQLSKLTQTTEAGSELLQSLLELERADDHME